MALLDVSDLHAGYGDGVAVLHGLEFSVGEGEFVTLIGANGAGKTTTLRSLTNLVRPTRGEVRFLGHEITRLDTAAIARLGIAMVPEGRGVFPGLTVYESLRIAATPWAGSGAAIARELELVYALFPVLRERRQQLGWSLSGGQQQMLAIGRALMARPKLLLLDEPSLGLAPNLVEQVFEKLREINAQGVAILLVEQNAFMALEAAQRGYVLEQGRIVAAGPAEALLRDPRVRAAYLGA